MANMIVMTSNFSWPSFASCSKVSLVGTGREDDNSYIYIYIYIWFSFIYVGGPSHVKTKRPNAYANNICIYIYISNYTQDKTKYATTCRSIKKTIVCFKPGIEFSKKHRMRHSSRNAISLQIRLFRHFQSQIISINNTWERTRTNQNESESYCLGL